MGPLCSNLNILKCQHKEVLHQFGFHAQKQIEQYSSWMHVGKIASLSDIKAISSTLFQYLFNKQFSNILHEQQIIGIKFKKIRSIFQSFFLLTKKSQQVEQIDCYPKNLAQCSYSQESHILMWEISGMGKKNQRYSKMYRQFTRVKFNKYKLQFPKIRQSEIIAKIIKEWEAMDQNAKQNLEKQYIERSGKGFLEDPSSSDKKSKEKQEKKSQPLSSSARESGTKKITKKPKKPSPKVRVFEQKEKKSNLEKVEKTQNSKSPGKKSTPSKNQTSSSQLAIDAVKSKMSLSKKTPEVKQKTKNEQYVNFYKYYYQKLSAEHARWSKNQITTIIKLLWRKRQTKKSRDRQGEVIGKSLSGRQLYNRTKLSEGFLKDQIRQLWRALPHESKKYWQIKGQGKPKRSQKDSGRFVRRVLNSGASKENQMKQGDSKSSFTWMSHNIN